MRIDDPFPTNDTPGKQPFFGEESNENAQLVHAEYSLPEIRVKAGLVGEYGNEEFEKIMMYVSTQDRPGLEIIKEDFSRNTALLEYAERLSELGKPIAMLISTGFRPLIGDKHWLDIYGRPVAFKIKGMQFINMLKQKNMVLIDVIFECVE